MPQLSTRTACLLILAVAFGCKPDSPDPAPASTGNHSDPAESEASAPIPESEPPSPPDNAAAAIRTFQSQALASLPQDLTPETKAFVVEAISDEEHLHARRQTCQTCFERIDGTLSQEERETLILIGAISDLRGRSRDCWEIMSFGGFGNSIEGYLDTETGRLLVLWIAPEG